ncbi:multiple epidermal growth factor-like domains protein 10 isoform X1 [Pseudomyrmex gracilis]|uniref:multiple epidermal growth factor-like domains protein 10 isoform X1 n=2 Tax=Pseudomyrmex gracilis TaxID=219809 RepID=UPI000994FBBC|nr:multiple epidermal growth factor-like domains protein 10 isoform X1 [Pseudomyrmex gracilis]
MSGHIVKTMSSAMRILLGSVVCLLSVVSARTAIMPPPWADPASNPCAAQPRGWQLLYWPADGKCYKIFQIGAPCPETMELAPAAGDGTTAECRCPPGTAQSPRDALCHPIFTRASCTKGQFFAPVPVAPGKSSSRKRWGICRDPEPCAEQSEIYWPRDDKCYPRLSRGPCPRGELLVTGEDGLAICSCSTIGELSRYHWLGGNGGCHEHYTKGPCSEPGELFLPGGTCGCNSQLPHYHESSGMCYQLGSVGPCPQGHHFVVTSDPRSSQEDVVRARCVCKSGHVLYKDGVCYRLHTRGPCEDGHMLINSTTCVPVPCKRGRLYFPQEKTCYKIGTRGPCPNGQIVLYDYNVRPSLDGISYNGVCGCTNVLRDTGRCVTDDSDDCESTPGMVMINRICYKLYTQGPCSAGEWLVAQRMPRSLSLWQDGEPRKPKARCECRPGYKRIVETSNEAADELLESNSLISSNGCQPPAVSLAKFLNDNVKLRIV